MGRHDEAREVFDEALENARAAGDDVGAAAILDNLGNEPAARGAFGEALLDEDFDLERVERALDEERPAIVHLASHAEFSGAPHTISFSPTTTA